MVGFRNLGLTAAFAFLTTSVLASPTTFDAKKGAAIPNSYIVTLKQQGHQSPDLESHLQWVGEMHKRSVGSHGLAGVKHRYEGATSYRGYSGTFDDATIEQIRNSPEVDFVEEDHTWTIERVAAPAVPPRSLPLDKRAVTQQTGAPWGLGTVSHRSKGSTTYRYDNTAGTGTWAYIVDTGINAAHVEFGGRAQKYWTAYSGDNEDSNGHGTHCAGTIGSAAYGVSKKATLLAVKVFQGDSASTSTILQGYNFAANDIVSKSRQNKAVISMSLGGGYSSSFNSAVDSASSKGVVSVIAAGNDGQDASGYSPGSAASAITIGAIDINWNLASFTNYGSVIDLFAPGVNILSCWIGSTTATNTISGTSMATPHVAGLVLYVQSVYGVTGVSGITNYLKSAATKNGITTGTKGSVNSIANNNVSGQ